MRDTLEQLIEEEKLRGIFGNKTTPTLLQRIIDEWVKQSTLSTGLTIGEYQRLEQAFTRYAIHCVSEQHANYIKSMNETSQPIIPVNKEDMDDGSLEWIKYESSRKYRYQTKTTLSRS